MTVWIILNPTDKICGTLWRKHVLFKGVYKTDPIYNQVSSWTSWIKQSYPVEGECEIRNHKYKNRNLWNNYMN